MGLRDELRDPWGGLLAGVAGGLAWAVAGAGAPALAAGVGVGAVVYGVKVVGGILSSRPADDERRRPSRAPAVPRPPRGSAAEHWLVRAEQAVRELTELAESPADAATRERVSTVDDDAASTLDALRRLAAQVTAVEAALTRVDGAELVAERQRLEGMRSTRQAADEGLRGELDRSIEAVQGQLAVHERLTTARDTLLARMQSAAIGLDGLVARLAEVLALASTAGAVDGTPERIADIGAELDGLRAGLAETEALSRRALAGQALPPLSGA